MSLLVETSPLPSACQKCRMEEDCGSCEHALERWHFVERDELLQRKALIEMAIKKKEKELEEVNSLIFELDKEVL